MCGLRTYSILDIHPICVIDEYAIMVRRWDWFIPIIPPSKAFSGAINMINLVDELCIINDMIISGANFCHVARIIHANQDIDVITEGNQKWNGAIPNFNIIADNRIRFICGIDLVDQWAKLVINISLDPRAWAIKYLIAASVSWLDLEFVISGIKLSMLISIDIHRNSQLVLDIAIIVLMRREDIMSSKKGLFV